MSLLFEDKRYLGNLVRLDEFGRAAIRVSVVCDPHEKLRFSDDLYSTLVLIDNGIWGCEDCYPHRDSELVLLGEITEQI